MRKLGIIISLLGFMMSSVQAANAPLGKDILILTNHLGYELNGPKSFVVSTVKTEQIDSFELIDYETGGLVLKGKVEKQGAVNKWRDWVFWKADFSKLNKPGQYVIRVTSPQESAMSFPFLVQENLLERNTISDVLNYFKGQRSSGLLDKADRNMKFSDPDKPRIDASGGWFDATGDYGKHLSHLSYSTYFNPQQTPLTVWALFTTVANLKSRDDGNFKQYIRRGLDEAMHGADYLVRVRAKEGSFIRSVSAPNPEKAAADRIISSAMRKFSIIEKKDTKRDFYGRDDVPNDIYQYEVGYRSGGGLAIAALAMASAYDESGDFSSQDYLATAKSAFDFLEKNNIHFANDGKENIVDDYCALMASTELYRVTGKDKYKAAADKRARQLMGRLASIEQYKDYWRADDGDRVFYHAADAGLPVVSLLSYYSIADKKIKQQVLDTVKRSLEFELSVTHEVNNPFGYARQFVQKKDGRKITTFFYPHDAKTAPWWQGENARLGSLATAARMAAPYFSKDKPFARKLHVYAWDQLSWILGLNPFDASMLTGTGRNNVEYLFFESYEYTNVPGGIVNGITAGLYDEEGIDLNRGYLETGKDNDWRWAEQWLPHASWYLVAASIE